MFGYNEWGSSESGGTPLTDDEIPGHEDAIVAEVVKNRCLKESERGIVHWYDEKVKLVVFADEHRNGKLWDVAECRVVDVRSPNELATLKDYISGQASDGWGEGLQQWEIHTDEGELLCIKCGETGYYPSDYSTDDKGRNVELVDFNSEKLSVTPWQRQALEVGSMCGWDVPGADPAKYLGDYNLRGLTQALDLYISILVEPVSHWMGVRTREKLRPLGRR